MNNSLLLIARSIKDSFPQYSTLTMGDITLGLAYVAKKHFREDKLWKSMTVDLKLDDENTNGEDPASRCNPEMVRLEMILWAEEILEEALLVYHPEKFTTFHDQYFLIKNMDSKHHQPAFFLRQDGQKIVLSVRGTKSLSDVFTDFHFVPVHFTTRKFYSEKVVDESDCMISGYVHHGIYASATWVFQQILPFLEKVFQNSKASLQIVTTGHSLGGGTAVILAILIRNWCMDQVLLFPEDLPKVHAVTFASVALFSAELSVWCKSFVTSFLLGGDLIPRFSPGQGEVLRQEIFNSQWKKSLKEWYNGWNESESPFERVNGWLERLKLPPIPTNLPFSETPTVVKSEKSICLYPAGDLYLFTYQENGFVRGRIRIVYPEFGRDYRIRHVSLQQFNSIIINSNMLEDHRMSHYFDAFHFMKVFIPRYEKHNSVFLQSHDQELSSPSHLNPLLAARVRRLISTEVRRVYVSAMIKKESTE